MTKRPTRGPAWVRRALIISTVIAVLGFASLLALYLQPWASCPGIDDSSAGCPVEGPQVIIQQVVMLILVAGVLGVGASALVLARYRSARR